MEITRPVLSAERTLQNKTHYDLLKITMKKILFYLALFSFMVPGYSFGISSHDIHIEWLYNQPSEAIVVAGYNLYLENVKICTNSNPSATSMDCVFEADAGNYEFTLTASFADNTESPHSSPYPFTLSQPEAAAADTTTTLPTPPPTAPEITTYDLHIEWNSEDSTTFGEEPTGYNLFQDGTLVYTSNSPGKTTMDCMIESEGGTSNFTLTAIYRDKSESPYFSPFCFNLSPTTEPELMAVMKTTSDVLTGDTPFSVSLDATNSAGNIASYTWDFGDGISATGNQVSHTYTKAGTYSAILIVTGASGAMSQSSLTITATSPPGILTDTASPTPPNTPPKAIISASASVGEAPFTAAFDGSESSDTEGAIASYSWNFGDGATASDVYASHTYTVAGTYTVALTVTDNQKKSSTIFTPIIISEPATINEPPVAQLSASSDIGAIPMEVTFSGATSTDPEEGPLNFTWNFGDGTTVQGMTVTHTFTSKDRYNVTLTVTDDAGASSSASTTITAQETITEFHIELDEVQIDNNWVHVNFAEPFLNPIVVAGPPSFSTSDPVVIRVRNITSSGFEIRLQGWNYLEESHPMETVSYLAMEGGTYTLSNGTQVEAGSIIANGTQSATIQFASTFSTEPVVLTTVSTINDTSAATSQLNTVSLAQATVSIVKEENSSDIHGEENVSYIAWEPTETTIGNMKVTAARTGKVVKHKWYGIDFGEPLLDTPLFLAAISPQAGGNTAALRYTNRTSSSVQVKVEEEQSKDNEMRHSREDIGYFLFSPSEQ